MAYPPGSAPSAGAARVRDALQANGRVVMPGVFDALSARIAVDAGFPVLFVSGFAVAATHMARPDVGYVGAAEIAAATRAVTGAVDVPVICDADTGYGNALTTLHTAENLARAGAAGVFLEDQVWPKRCGHIAGKQVVDAREWLGRVRALVDLRERGTDLFITARTDALAAVGLDEALARAKAAADLGVDAVFVEAPRDEQDMVRIAEATPGVVRVANMVEGGVTPILSAERLAELGFRLVVCPLTALFAATAAMRDNLRALAKDGVPPPPSIGFDAFNHLMRLDEHRALEAHYDARG